MNFILEQPYTKNVGQRRFLENWQFREWMLTGLKKMNIALFSC